MSFVFMFGGISYITVNADEPVSQKMCVKDHFNRLNGTDDAPPNMNGSCTFVAMSMLLSFYDVYWNEQFVAPFDHSGDSSNLEFQKGYYSRSSDTLYYTFNANNEVRDWNNHVGNIYDFVANNKDKYLQSYLIDMCNELPIIDEFGVLDYQVQDLLERYLYIKRGFTTNQVIVNIEYAQSVGDEELIRIMKEQINSGNPVIFFGFSDDLLPEEIDSDDVLFGGHAMIGYDVTTTNGQDDIVLNLGWNDGSTQTVRTTDFHCFKSIIWLEINEENLPHICSDSYYDFLENEYYCACEVYYYTHSTHSVHIYSGLEYYNSQSHCYRCGCGYITNIQSHNLSYSYYSPTQHYKICSDCIYSGAETHSYIVQNSSSSSGHNLVCACGDSIAEAHSPNRYESKNKTSHYKYCKCGYLIGTENHDMYKSGIYNVCRDCGYMSNSLTDITIKGVGDEEATDTE